MNPEREAQIREHAELLRTLIPEEGSSSIMLPDRRDLKALAALVDAVPALLDTVKRVREWANSDVVTARNEFGSGYREALRDVRDLLGNEEPE